MQQPSRTTSTREKKTGPTQADITKASQGGYYIKAAPGSKGTQLISGAIGYWRTHPNVIYVPGAQLVGTPEDVTAVLTKLGQYPETINQLLAGAYTRDNYNVPAAQGGQQEAFETELAQRKGAIKTTNINRAQGIGNRGQPIVTLDMLPYILNSLKATGVVSNVPSRRKVGVTSRRVVTSTRGLSLAEKINALAAGKSIDVTGIKDNSTGTRVINTPGVRSDALGSPDLPIVSRDRNSYIRALGILAAETGRDYNQDVANWDAAYAARLGGRQGVVINRRNLGALPPTEAANQLLVGGQQPATRPLAAPQLGAVFQIPQGASFVGGLTGIAAAQQTLAGGPPARGPLALNPPLVNRSAALVSPPQRTAQPLSPRGQLQGTLPVTPPRSGVAGFSLPV